MSENESWRVEARRSTCNDWTASGAPRTGSSDDARAEARELNRRLGWEKYRVVTLWEVEEVSR